MPAAELQETGRIPPNAHHSMPWLLVSYCTLASSGSDFAAAAVPCSVNLKPAATAGLQQCVGCSTQLPADETVAAVRN